MSIKSKVLVAALLCLTALGCATPQVSELQKPEGNPYLFVIPNESKVFSVAYQALLREVKAEDIKELNGPVRGFYARTESWSASNIYWVRIFAANGVNKDMRNTYGYYAEVMVEGNKGTERDKAIKIFDDIEAVLAQQGQKVYVRNLQKAQYRNESTGDYKSGAYNFEAAPRQARPDPVQEAEKPREEAPVIKPDPELANPARGEYVPPKPQPTTGSTGSMADELLKLNELRKQGILSDEEFKKAKERLLGI